MDAGVMLKPLLSRGELRCIGATTTDKYRRFIEKDPALERRFQQVGVGGFRVGGQGYGVKGVAWHCQMSEKEQERGWCGCGQRACMHAVKHGGL